MSQIKTKSKETIQNREHVTIESRRSDTEKLAKSIAKFEADKNDKGFIIDSPEHAPVYTSIYAECHNSMACLATKIIWSDQLAHHTVDCHSSPNLPSAPLHHLFDANQCGAIENLVASFHDSGGGSCPDLVEIGATGHGSDAGWSQCGNPQAAATARSAVCCRDRPHSPTPEPLQPPPLAADDPFHDDWPHW